MKGDRSRAEECSAVARAIIPKVGFVLRLLLFERVSLARDRLFADKRHQPLVHPMQHVPDDRPARRIHFSGEALNPVFMEVVDLAAVLGL